MYKDKISKILIANRGEIARRIQKACDLLGLDYLSIASKEDENSLFAREARELKVIEANDPLTPYLDHDLIIETALEHSCKAIHPGYGFLAENPLFAKKAAGAGLTFIGPRAETIEALGDKTEAREIALKCGLPCIPGTGRGLSDKQLLKQAKKLGFPLMLKAVGGGGGRGMRVVSSQEELEAALPRARAEAKKSFANDDLYFEKYLSNPRHIEVQVFGDGSGGAVHFGTRECSIQRRHQKVIEEAPAPNLTPGLKGRVCEMALKITRFVKYLNAGTVEFLLSGDDIFFLEMNTRIQVEHPVTEVVSGIDLVNLQLKIAAGAKLPAQSDIYLRGHAVELRIYAEDPEENFMPTTGVITGMCRPEREYIREDTAFSEGDEITPYYDALISKMVVCGKTRVEAVGRSLEALREYRIDGPVCNLDFLKWIVSHRNFVSGEVDTGFVEREFKSPSKLLDELKASEIRDPLHKKGPAGAEVVEYYRYHSARFDYSYTIEVLHESGGLFVASPVSRDGKKAACRNRRRSNGLNMAVKSVIGEVLERIPPEIIF